MLTMCLDDRLTAVSFLGRRRDDQIGEFRLEPRVQMYLRLLYQDHSLLRDKELDDDRQYLAHAEPDIDRADLYSSPLVGEDERHHVAEHTGATGAQGNDIDFVRDSEAVEPVVDDAPVRAVVKEIQRELI